MRMQAASPAPSAPAARLWQPEHIGRAARGGRGQAQGGRRAGWVLPDGGATHGGRAQLRIADDEPEVVQPGLLDRDRLLPAEGDRLVVLEVDVQHLRGFWSRCGRILVIMRLAPVRKRPCGCRDVLPTATCLRHANTRSPIAHRPAPTEQEKQASKDARYSATRTPHKAPRASMPGTATHDTAHAALCAWQAAPAAGAPAGRRAARRSDMRAPHLWPAILLLLQGTATVSFGRGALM